MKIMLKGEQVEFPMDVGSGHLLRFHSLSSGPRDVAVGAIASHPDKRDEAKRCEGSITFNVPEASSLERDKWEVSSVNPLTLTPSLLCTECGRHGFITEGKWVPAE